MRTLAILAIAAKYTATAALAAGETTIRYSLDIAAAVDQMHIDDHELAEEVAGGISVVELQGIDAGVDLKAYHRGLDGTDFAVFDVATKILGLVAETRDVIRLGTSPSIALDGDVAGIPDGTAIDALSMTASGHFVLSFDITVALAGQIFDDADLVRFDGTTFSLLLDGTSAGLAPAFDIDAAHLLESQEAVLVSLDGSGILPGIGAFNDEDVLELDLNTFQWTSSTLGPSLLEETGPLDVDALFVSLGPPPADRIFCDGFETGDTSAWSETIP